MPNTLRELTQAAREGDMEKLRKLLPRHSYLINNRERYSISLLEEAARHGRREAAEFLVEQGADPHQVTDYETPLHYAAMSGDKETVQFFIQQGIAVNKTTQSGTTPLHCAAESGGRETVQCLMEHGADIHQVDDKDETPLHKAAGAGNKETMKFLIEEQGAVVDKANDRGWTPLHLAIVGGHKEAAKLLIGHGASIYKATKDGVTPLEFARAYERTNIENLLTSESLKKRIRKTLGISLAENNPSNNWQRRAKSINNFIETADPIQLSRVLALSNHPHKFKEFNTFLNLEPIKKLPEVMVNNISMIKYGLPSIIIRAIGQIKDKEGLDVLKTKLTKKEVLSELEPRNFRYKLMESLLNSSNNVNVLLINRGFNKDLKELDICLTRLKGEYDKNNDPDTKNILKYCARKLDKINSNLKAKSHGIIGFSFGARSKIKRLRDMCDVDKSLQRDINQNEVARQSTMTIATRARTNAVMDRT